MKSRVSLAKKLSVSIKILFNFSLILGVFYPFSCYFLGQWIFPEQANGSLLQGSDGTVQGSFLIGQKFAAPEYFWSRPSSIDYHAESSGATNWSGTSTKLKEEVIKRKKEMSSYSGMPFDGLYASGSGLDPHISVENAYSQIERVAQARKLDPAQQAELKKLLESQIEKRTFTFLGEDRVNVLKLNLALKAHFEGKD